MGEGRRLPHSHSVVAQQASWEEEEEVEDHSDGVSSWLLSPRGPPREATPPPTLVSENDPTPPARTSLLQELLESPQPAPDAEAARSGDAPTKDPGNDKTKYIEKGPQ